MPATYAHYVFGKKVYKKLPASVKQIIRENREAYLIGLHGPDLLFYYRPVWKNPINQQGGRMHREPASDFFEKSRHIYQDRPDYVLLSYLLGFICHFALDSACHPYIADYMEARGVSHSDIETELDRALLEKDGKNPVLSDYTRHLRRDLDTEEAIASVLEVTPEQVDRSILGFRWMIRFFQCPHRGKERAAGFLCTVLGKHSFVKGLFMTGRENAACRDAREFLESRLEEAVDTAVKLILEYYRKIDGCQALSAGFERDFE